MNATRLLRIASIIAFLFALGHTMGGPWTPSAEAGAASVVEAMKSVRFDVMGASRSFWEFYFGFGVSISIYMFMLAVFLWLLAALAKYQLAMARRFVAVVLVAYAANAFILWRYFFIVPLIFSIVMVVCLALVLWVSRTRTGA